MMKKFLFSFLAALVGVCGFGGISSATYVSEIDVTADIPVSGDKVGAMDNTLGQVGDTLYGIQSVSYKRKNGYSWDELDSDYTFQSGNTYRVILTLGVLDSTSDSFSGYDLQFDKVKINNQVGVIDTYESGDTIIIIHLEFTLLAPEKTSINTVGASDIHYPADGKIRLQALAEMQASGHSLSNLYSMVDYLFYVKNGASWDLMDDGDIFSENGEYKLGLVFELEDKINYDFGDAITCTINGEGCDSVADSGEFQVVAYKEFLTTKTISAINFTGPVSILSGDNIGLVFELGEVDDAELSGYSYGDYSIVKWVDNSWIGVDVENELVAINGTNYGFKVPLNIHTYSGYFLSDSPSFSYNGVNWLNSGHTYFDVDGNDYILYIDLGTIGSTTSAQLETTGGETTGAVEQAPAVGGGGSGGYSRSSTPSTNTEIKKVEQTGDALIYSGTNELIPVDYLKEELEKNKELYKNAPIKVMVALLNLTRADIFRLKNTADAYKKAAPEVKQNVLAVLNGLANDNSKRAKYVSDYFKYIAGIE